MFKKYPSGATNGASKLSETKTVAIIFSHNQQALQSKINMKLNGETISTEEIPADDIRSTWNKHIEKVIDNCKVKMNPLRSLTGQQWGACKKSLLHTYNTKHWYATKVRVWNWTSTHSKNALKKMEVVQNRPTCLRITRGAMHGTAVDTLQQS